MCDLYPVFRSCCGVSVRIAMLYIAILSIVTGALINAALKKVGLDIASIEAIKGLSEDGDGSPEAGRPTDDATGFGENVAVGGARLRATEEEYYYEDETTKAKAKTTTTTSTTPSTRPAPTMSQSTHSFVEKVTLMNRHGMNLLSGAFVCLGVLLLLANFMRSPELALVSVAATVAVAVASLVLLAGVVGECAKQRDMCLLNKLDWFTSFIVTLFWFMYVFCWLFFAGVTNAFANGAY